MDSKTHFWDSKKSRFCKGFPQCGTGFEGNLAKKGFRYRAKSKIEKKKFQENKKIKKTKSVCKGFPFCLFWLLLSVVLRDFVTESCVFAILEIHFAIHKKIPI